MIAANTGILSIERFQISGSHESHLQPKFNLATNQETIGPSPLVLKVLRKAWHSVSSYPDIQAIELRKKIAQYVSGDDQQIICANGSEELIYLLPRAFASCGDEIIINDYSFPVYEIAIKSVGAIPVKAKSKCLRIVVDNVLGAITSKTKIIFIDNPGNPSGQYLTRDEIKRLVEGTPSHVLLVIDGAYGEYVLPEDYTDSREWVKPSGHVMILHTFSKFFGLAGLRLGWAYGPLWAIDILDRIRAPFNVNSLVQKIAPLALEDRQHCQKVKKSNFARLQSLRTHLQQLGIETPMSVTNFLIPQFPSAEVTQKVSDFLYQQGILVKHLSVQGLPDRIRISVGCYKAQRALVTELGKIFK